MSKQHLIPENLYNLLYTLKQYQNQTIPFTALLMMMKMNKEELQKLKRPNKNLINTKLTLTEKAKQ